MKAFSPLRARSLPTRFLHFLLLLVIAGFFAACAAPDSSSTDSTEPSMPAEEAVAEVDAVADELWQNMLDEGIYQRIRQGLPIRELPDWSLEETQSKADEASARLARLADLPIDALPHEDRLSLRLLRHQLGEAENAPQHYWTVFPFTPYVGGGWISIVHRALAAQKFETADDLDGYLQLVGEYRDAVEQLIALAEGQIERGIFLHRPALPRVLMMWEAFRTSSAAACAVDGSRIAVDDADAVAAFEAALPEAIAEVTNAYERLLEILGDPSYAEQAPADVGWAQIPGGEEYYRAQVRHHTTMDISPEEVHQIGLDRMERIAEKMKALRDQIGFEGTQAEFHDQLRKDPRFIAESPEEVGELFMSHIARIEPLVDQYFLRTPEAPYGVRRLGAESEGSMTFGYYQAPSAEDPVGRYLFNGSNLEERPTIGAAGLIFHELVPGHHFQIALMNENESLPMFRREGFGSTAFVEGWAEYAAELPEEMGLYEDPYDAYGHLLNEAFLSARLVVDTGMNILGWSLEEARQYLRERTFLSELEIETETLRYSTDMPGQALAYKMGHHQINVLRARAEEALGEKFDIREFHEAVLGSGILPMTVLEEHIEHYIAQHGNDA